jgi:hypothetical protein
LCSFRFFRPAIQFSDNLIVIVAKSSMSAHVGVYELDDDDTYQVATLGWSAHPEYFIKMAHHAGVAHKHVM